jgi:hypothetical protein
MSTFYTALYFLSFWSSKPWIRIRIGIQAKTLDPDESGSEILLQISPYFYTKIYNILCNLVLFSGRCREGPIECVLDG